MLVCAVLISKPALLNGQTTDSLSLIKRFLTAGNDYKSYPLYLELEVSNATNHLVNEDDTATVVGHFYMRSEASYVQFGEVEQLINDSFALLVSSKLQQMILFKDPQIIANQLKAITGSVWQDSSVALIAEKFTVQPLEQRGDVSAIRLDSRRLLSGTSLPKESIEFHYNFKATRPERMRTVKRTLLPLTKEQYESLKEKGDGNVQLVVFEGSGFFLVRELATTFTYKQISHDKDLKIPVLMSQRIVKDGDGVFLPVQAFQSYMLTVN